MRKMKKGLFLGVLFLLVGVCIIAESTNRELFVLSQIEVLSQSESELPEGVKQNYRKITYWYDASIPDGELYLNEDDKPLFTNKKNWKSMKCCINSVDMVACDFNMESPECEGRAKRY